jgi:hypothetical protein
MQQGDHLVSVRIGYSHHGLYIGHNRVIHYSGSLLGELQTGVVEIIDLETFCQGNGYSVNSYPFRTYDRETSIERAKSRLGEDGYNVLLNNCEHFVTWCIMGLHSSAQVNRLIDGMIVSKAILNDAVETTVVEAVSGLVIQHAKEGTTRHLVPAVSSALGTAAFMSTSASISTGVISTLTATTLSSIALPAIAGSLIGYGALKLLGSFFDD